MHNDRSRQAFCFLKDLSPSCIRLFDPNRPDIMTVKIPDRKLPVDQAVRKLHCDFDLFSSPCRA